MHRLLHLPRLAVSALCAALAGAATGLAAAEGVDTIRVKDLGKLHGWRANALVGHGLVTGLAGTGDSPANPATRQALANVFAQFDVTVPPEQVQSRNVAVVLVSASLPPFARDGDTLDVVVTSAGDARSLVGGSLLLTPLRAPNGRVHALAHGALAVGGYRYDANGNVVQKNHPTVGAVPGGATVEVGVVDDVRQAAATLTFVLHDPDYTTASRVAEAINAQAGRVLAEARDASGIDIVIPEEDRARPVAFLARLESVRVQPDRRARVVIDERTGTVVSGGDVRLSRVAVTHGDLRVTIAAEDSVSQPTGTWRPGPGVHTAVVRNSRVEVDEAPGIAFVAGHDTVADLVQALARLKTHTRDVISILRAVKAAGALHADLVVQ